MVKRKRIKEGDILYISEFEKPLSKPKSNPLFNPLNLNNNWI